MQLLSQMPTACVEKATLLPNPQGGQGIRDSHGLRFAYLPAGTTPKVPHLDRYQDVGCNSACLRGPFTFRGAPETWYFTITTVTERHDNDADTSAKTWLLRISDAVLDLF